MDITQSSAARATPEPNQDVATALQDTLKSPARKQSEHALPRGIKAWGVDLALFLGMFVFLAAFAKLLNISFGLQPFADHFILQAQAWLHGHLDIAEPTGGDFVLVNGKHYIIYPPLPALLMLPFIAVLGSHFSDVWFTWIAGAANVALTYRVLEAMRLRGWTLRTQRENIIMALVFGTGTIALWLTLGGRVWFTSQTLAVTALLVMLYGAVAQRWWLASLGVGAALLTRSPDVLGGIFVLVAFAHAHGFGISDETSTNPLWQRLRLRAAKWPSVGSLLALAVPFLVACAILGLRNKFYFGNFFDTGYGIQITQDYPQIKYGLLSWHYMWSNFVIDFLNMPNFVFKSPFDVAPRFDVGQNGIGTSIFFTTPLFLLFFASPGKTSQPWARITLWVVTAIIVLIALAFNAGGWFQVGARYLFDVYPFLMMLLALRAESISKRWLALATAGVLINIFLASTFWCNNSECLGVRYTTTHHLVFFALLASVVGAAVLAWQWLRQEREQADNMLPSA